MLPASHYKLAEQPPATLCMVNDTGAERHAVCGRDYGHARNRRPLEQPIILKTANRETEITEQGDVTRGGAELVGRLLCPTASSSLLSTTMLTDQGWQYAQSRIGAVLQSAEGSRCNLLRGGNLFLLSDSQLQLGPPQGTVQFADLLVLTSTASMGGAVE